MSDSDMLAYTRPTAQKWESLSPAALAQLVRMEGTPNLRDLGGYRTLDGKHVKRGMVFRSGELYALTDHDLDTLAKLGLTTIVDFRSRKEQDAKSDRVPPTVRTVADLAIFPGDLGALLAGGNDDAAFNAMVGINRMLVHDAQTQYTEFFRLLSDPKNLSLLFHCTAGKDRVGFGSGLFLSALGVDRETVYQDFALSAECVREQFRLLVEKRPKMAAIFGAEREFLAAAFEEIDTHFGGVESYLTKQLGVDLALLRSIYTE